MSGATGPRCHETGRTEAEAVANVKDAAALWIDAAAKVGDPVPFPRRRAVH